MAGAAEECQSPTTALRRAEMMSRMAGSIGAVAFSRSGDPMMGEFGDAKLLRKFEMCRMISAGCRLVIASEAKQSILSCARKMDCFAEPVIGRAFARPGGSQ